MVETVILLFEVLQRELKKSWTESINAQTQKA